MRSERSPDPVWSEMHLRLAVEGAGVALWAWHVDTDALTLDGKACDLWGVEAATHVTFEELSSKIHPSDRDRVRAAFKASRAVLGPYEIDFRIAVDDEVRWISARGKGDDEGMVDRRLFGLFLDVTGRKQAEESNELLAGEMSHRVKNLLAIASSLTSVTSRSCASTEDMAKQLTTRLIALGRAHDLVRPAPGQSHEGALLGDLISVLLAPYDEDGSFSGRIRVSVPRLLVSQASATTLALVIHELATNALKYGALSVEEGTLDISASGNDDPLLLIWAERGGPPVTKPSEDTGYGSKLINRAMSVQLNGAISCEWEKEGVIVTLAIGRRHLSS